MNTATQFVAMHRAVQACKIEVLCSSLRMAILRVKMRSA